MIANNRIIAGEAGVIGTMVEVLEKHIDNPNACLYACGTLKNTTYDNSKTICLTVSKLTIIFRGQSNGSRRGRCHRSNIESD